MARTRATHTQSRPPKRRVVAVPAPDLAQTAAIGEGEAGTATLDGQAAASSAAAVACLIGTKLGS